MTDVQSAFAHHEGRTDCREIERRYSAMLAMCRDEFMVTYGRPQDLGKAVLDAASGEVYRCFSCTAWQHLSGMGPALTVFWEPIPNKWQCKDADACYERASRLPHAFVAEWRERGCP